jgi:hypothetical protein
VLIALTLAGEAGYLKSAQDIVANEAAAASRSRHDEAAD